MIDHDEEQWHSYLCYYGDGQEMLTWMMLMSNSVFIVSSCKCHVVRDVSRSHFFLQQSCMAFLPVYHTEWQVYL